MNLAKFPDLYFGLIIDMTFLEWWDKEMRAQYGRPTYSAQEAWDAAMKEADVEIKRAQSQVLHKDDALTTAIRTHGEFQKIIDRSAKDADNLRLRSVNEALSKAAEFCVRVRDEHAEEGFVAADECYVGILGMITGAIPKTAGEARAEYLAEKTKILDQIKG